MFSLYKRYKTPEAALMGMKLLGFALVHSSCTADKVKLRLYEAVTQNAFHYKQQWQPRKIILLHCKQDIV